MNNYVKNSVYKKLLISGLFLTLAACSGMPEVVTQFNGDTENAKIYMLGPDGYDILANGERIGEFTTGDYRHFISFKAVPGSHSFRIENGLPEGTGELFSLFDLEMARSSVAVIICDYFPPVKRQLYLADQKKCLEEPDIYLTSNKSGIKSCGKFSAPKKEFSWKAGGITYHHEDLMKCRLMDRNAMDPLWGAYHTVTADITLVDNNAGSNLDLARATPDTTQLAKPQASVEINNIGQLLQVKAETNKDNFSTASNNADSDHTYTASNTIPLEQIDPTYAKSSKLYRDMFVPNGRKGVKIHEMGISKKIHKRAIKNADSGHAYDAFMAALAYRVGYFRLGNFRSSNTEGIDTDKYLYYLEKSAALGWAEASMILYQCNKHEPQSTASYSSSRGIPGVDLEYLKNLHVWCLKTYNPEPYPKETSYPRPSIHRAKEHLKRALLDGRYFRANENFRDDLKYVGPSLEYESSLQYEIKNWFIEIEIAVNGQHDRDDFAYQQALFPEARKNCDAHVEYLLEKSRKHYEPRYCGNGSPYGRSLYAELTRGQMKCPGFGYYEVRNYLETCMDISGSTEGWDRFYEYRLELYDGYIEGDTKIFDKGLMAYAKRNDHKKSLWVDKKRLKAIEVNRNSKERWAEKDRQIIMAKENYSARRSAEKEAERRELEEDERVSTEKYNRLQARIRQSNAETAAVWRQSEQQRDTSWDNIERMERQTMQDINASMRNAQTANNASITSTLTRSNSPQTHYKLTPTTRQTTRKPSANNTFSDEKENCINAGKRWTGSSCDYSVGNNIPHHGYAYTCDSPNITEAYEGQCQKQRQRSQADPQQNTSSKANTRDGYPGDSVNSENTGSDSGLKEALQTQDSGKQAWAYCWETKSGSFICDGPLQLILSGEKTLRRALEITDCPNGQHVNGNWYDCRRPLKWTEYHKERDVRDRRRGQ
ncbi:MAG: hypothetical protein KUG71_13530 [Porticoccaceae bacterium]|nr:hypothetical protein [Porticoccaceae bacterium]